MNLKKQPPKGDKTMKQLTKQQRKLLAITPDSQLLKVFPGFTREYLREEKRKCKKATPEETIDRDRKALISKLNEAELSKKYKKSLAIINSIQQELNATLQLSKCRQTYRITPATNAHSEATAIIVASDWHYEEQIKPSYVSGLNQYNLEIADQRINRFFQNALRLINICKQDIEIDNIVLALLGDFISGNIHDENLETGQLRPIDAAFAVQGKLMSGIKFLLEKTKCDIIVPCSVGNHSKITEKIHVSTETGNSLEGLMYHNMAMYFEDEPRVKFVISESYHTYLTIYNRTLRLHHGHAIRYNGGIGGIYIPVSKAIAQWNKAKFADLDVFGHWHQQRDGGNFITNGSLIGYNAYALRIKADYEEPKQAFFLIDKDRGKTIVAPILVDRN